MKTIGITLTYQIFSGVVKDHALDGGVRVYPEDPAQTDALVELPMERLVEVISDQVIALCGDQAASVGLALPGIVRGGIVEDSPNLPQLKGVHITEQVTAELKRRNCTPLVNAMNDADAIAAGIAATGTTPGMCRLRRSSGARNLAPGSVPILVSHDTGYPKINRRRFAL